MGTEQGNVAVTFAQRGKLNRNNVDAVVEILAEAAGVNHLFQVFMGGADQPKVDLALGAAAQALHHMIFQHPQQLGLERKGEGRDLIQKECALIREFNLTGP